MRDWLERIRNAGHAAYRELVRDDQSTDSNSMHTQINPFKTSTHHKFDYSVSSVKCDDDADDNSMYQCVETKEINRNGEKRIEEKRYKMSKYQNGLFDSLKKNRASLPFEGIRHSRSLFNNEIDSFFQEMDRMRAEIDRNFNNRDDLFSNAGKVDDSDSKDDDR